VCCPLPPPCVGTSDQGKPTSLFHQPIWRLPGVSYPDGDASLLFARATPLGATQRQAVTALGIGQVPGIDAVRAILRRFRGVV